MRNAARIATLALAGLALAAPAVAATFTTGDYKGKTSQVNRNTKKHRKISLHADATTNQVTDIKFVETGTCNDGSRTEGSQGTGGNNLYADVDSNGHFSLVAKSTTGATKLTMSGDLSGDQASGTFTVKSRFNGSGNPDPHGGVRCTSGTVTWSAKLVG